MKRVLIYAIAVVLVFSYMIILFAGMDTSKTDDSYNLFYLEQQLKYYPSREEFEKYCENTDIVYTSDGNYMNQGKKWEAPETTGTWSTGNRSAFFIYANSLDTGYEIQINTGDDCGYENSLFVNGVKVGDLPTDVREYRLNICDGLVKGLNKFEIVTDEEVLPYNKLNPDSNDARTLNVLVQSICLKKTGELSDNEKRLLEENAWLRERVTALENSYSYRFGNLFMNVLYKLISGGDY